LDLVLLESGPDLADVPERALDVLERALAAGARAQVEVEADGREPAEVVEADAPAVAVAAPVVGLADANARLERGDLEPRGLVPDPRCVLGEVVEEDVLVGEAAAAHEQRGVVIGHALEPIERAGLRQFRVVERPEYLRADAFHVPEMEEFVRAHARGAGP